MTQEWNIQGRAEKCARTGRPFTDGEVFFTLLHEEGDLLRREDICTEAWEAMHPPGSESAVPPFSFWRGKYEPPPPLPVESVTKADAESHLRQLLAQGPPPEKAAVAYLLAALLERKRIIKPVARTGGEGESSRVLPYEHAKTGELFLVPNTAPRLDEIERVQAELKSILG